MLELPMPVRQWVSRLEGAGSYPQRFSSGRAVVGSKQLYLLQGPTCCCGWSVGTPGNRNVGGICSLKPAQPPLTKEFRRCLGEAGQHPSRVPGGRPLCQAGDQGLLQRLSVGTTGF